MLETKVDILEKRLVRETKNESVQNLTLSTICQTSSPLDMNSNSKFENTTKTPPHITIITKPKKPCPKSKLGRLKNHRNSKYPQSFKIGHLKII